jgi:hypothetical protein
MLVVEHEVKMHDLNENGISWKRHDESRLVGGNLQGRKLEQTFNLTACPK